MNKQMLFLKKIREAGQSAVLHTESGDACPCVESDGYYDAQWHADNPEEDDCEGTLIINTVSTDTNIRALILPKVDIDERVKEKIGFRDEDDYLFMGAYNTSDNSLVDVSDLDEAHDYITFKGDRFILRDVDREMHNDDILYYYGIMKKVASS